MGAGIQTPAVHAADSSLAGKLVASQRPLVIGHRGYSKFAPENTLPSFQLAKLAGADLVELDYHVSEDGIPVVIHDYELDRTTDATNRWGRAHLKVAGATSAQMKTLDAGSWFGAGYAGTRIPTLEEAIAFINDSGVTLIERKSGSASQLAEFLRGRQLVNRVVVQSFDWRFLTEFHAQLPDQLFGALGPPSNLADGTKPAKEDKQLSLAYLEQVAALGASVLVWSREVSADAIRLCHARGLKLWVYTIDDPDQAQQLLEMGIDGIITNNPSLIWRTLALRGQMAAGK